MREKIHMHKTSPSQAVVIFKEVKELQNAAHHFMESGSSKRPEFFLMHDFKERLSGRNIINRTRGRFASVSESVSVASLGNNNQKTTRMRLSEIADTKVVPVQSEEDKNVGWPSVGQLIRHPLALLAFVPKDLALFIAGAGAGAAAKTVTAPLDRVKLLMQLSVLGRLAAGACAGMTSTLVTYPNMSQIAINMIREEGIASFYKGLGPSLLGIAPYIALNFCIFDLVKKSLPEEYRKRSEASFATAIISASFATIMCYPLDTVRRQMQMKGSPYKTVLDAFPGIIARDGVIGLYRGFVPNALKNLPNSSIRLTTFDAAKGLIQASQKELHKIMKANREQKF